MRYKYWLFDKTFTWTESQEIIVHCSLNPFSSSFYAVHAKKVQFEWNRVESIVERAQLNSNLEKDL